eukprot:TRINITY_DN4947_c0_g1_i1.p1 TRINITY_DN4947_c0_g1~~TRINITY_DN4947_c0_g1_i1.p1  ORF type:complete len:510 (-),score=203.48 TRINITY_DN4947_c0_g1_i1:58-1587(-)
MEKQTRLRRQPQRKDSPRGSPRATAHSNPLPSLILSSSIKELSTSTKSTATLDRPSSVLDGPVLSPVLSRAGLKRGSPSIPIFAQDFEYAGEIPQRVRTPEEKSQALKTVRPKRSDLMRKIISLQDKLAEVNLKNEQLVVISEYSKDQAAKIEEDNESMKSKVRVERNIRKSIELRRDELERSLRGESRVIELEKLISENIGEKLELKTQLGAELERTARLERQLFDTNVTCSHLINLLWEMKDNEDLVIETKPNVGKQIVGRNKKYPIGNLERGDDPLSKRATELSQENESLKAKLKIMEKRVDEREEAVKRKDLQEKKLLEEIEGVQKRLAERESDAHRDHIKLKKIEKKIDEERSDHQRELSMLSKKISAKSYQDKVDEFREQQRAAREEKSKKKDEELRLVSSELSEANFVKDELAKKCEFLTGRLEKLQKRTEELSANQEMLERDRRTDRQKIDNTHKDLLALTKKCDALERDKKRLETDLADSEKECQDTKARLRDRIGALNQ